MGDNPRLDERAIPVEFEILIAVKMHGRVVHEEAFLETLEVLIEAAFFFHRAYHDARRMEHRAHKLHVDGINTVGVAGVEVFDELE